MGASVQLVAYLNGERIDATLMAHQPWRALVHDPDYKSLVLIECGLRASRVTLGNRQFFRHHSEVACSIDHKSESEQHLAMKRALKDKIDTMSGWRAEVEHAHPDRTWIADVMAIHVSGRRLAFEVQLSQQNEDEYIRRSQRYADDRVGAVWIVPDSIDWFRVQMPMIVTGFGKTSALPATPGSLMDLTHYQPMFGKSARVDAAVDAVLHPAFSWPYGTPKHQLEEIARLEQMKLEEIARLEQMKAKAAAEEEERAAQLAEKKRLADEKAALEAAKLEASFIESATAPTVRGARPVLARKRIWASAVRCMEAGHPTLIWRLTEPASSSADTDDPWMPKSENLASVRGSVDAWLAANPIGLIKAGIHRLKGIGDRKAFACPECKSVIKGRWVSALPPAKWSVIAEASVASAEAREVLYRRPLPQPAPSEEKLLTPAEEKQRPVVLPVHIGESDWRFIGPRRKPYWMTEASGAVEIAQRLAAKEAYAIRVQQLRDNPRYRVSPNGFRFHCTDCGGMFEDDREGRHADRGCLVPGARGFDWR